LICVLNLAATVFVLIALRPVAGGCGE